MQKSTIILALLLWCCGPLLHAQQRFQNQAGTPEFDENWSAVFDEITGNYVVVGGNNFTFSSPPVAEAWVSQYNSLGNLVTSNSINVQPEGQYIVARDIEIAPDDQQFGRTYYITGLFIKAEMNGVPAVNEIFVARIDALGQVLWIWHGETQPGIAQTEGISVSTMANGDVIAVGNGVYYDGSINVIAARFDPFGAQLWSNYYARKEARYYMARESTLDRFYNGACGPVQSDEGVIIVGEERDEENANNFGGIRSFAMRLDGSGVECWRRVYPTGTPNDGFVADAAYDVTPDEDSKTFLVAGSATDVSGINSIYLFRIDPTGNLLCGSVYNDMLPDGTISPIYARGIEISLQNRTAVISGPRRASGTIFMAEVDCASDPVWANTYPGPNTATNFVNGLPGIMPRGVPEDVITVRDPSFPGYFVTANAQPGGIGATDGHIVKTDPAGFTPESCRPEPISLRRTDLHYMIEVIAKETKFPDWRESHRITHEYPAHEIYCGDHGNPCQMTVQIIGESIDPCGNDRLVTIVGGGTAPYTYVWNTGAVTPDITINASGTYCVTVTDAAGCTASTCFTATVHGAISLNITQQPSPSCDTATLTANANGGMPCQGDVYYIRSNGGQPWGQSTNEASMDAVYGAGNWTQAFYQTANPLTVFSPATGFVFMEGGDNNALAMNTFVTANIATIEAWVAAGGRLFMNAAPNQGTSMNWGFGGVVNNYNPPATLINNVYQAAAHPVFAGPFLPTATSFFGNYYLHSRITGPGLTSILNDAGGNSGIALGTWGAGLTAFGGMTTTNFHTPSAESANLRQNIMVFLGVGGNGYTYTWNTGETTASIDVTTPGPHCVTVTDCRGCTASACYTAVFSHPIITLTQTANPDDCKTTVVTASAGGGTGCGAAFYLRSNVGDPWGSTTNQNEMNTVFGMGNWTQDYFETANAAAIFAPSTGFVFLEGGDFMATAMDAFVSANITLIETWVAGGGQLFMNAAPNVGGSMNWGFGGVVNNYIPPTTWVNNVYQASMHPVFTGPYTPTATSFYGNYYLHSNITGPGIASILDDIGGNSGLAWKNWGSGTVFFGGMTTTNWHTPTLEATNFRQNILSYLGGAGGGGYTYSWSNGATTPSITTGVPGTYCVTVTDCNGCTESACIQVIVSVPQVTITQDQICAPAVLSANATGGVGCGGDAYYIHSNIGDPWTWAAAGPLNQNQMDAVFGAGNWILDYFESANAATVFSPSTSFVFLEGGDDNALAMDAFVTANISLIETWVAGGGHIFMNAAPNVGGSMNWGFGGVVNNYPGFQSNGVAVNPSHPIYLGPFTPTVTSYTGTWWAHSHISGGGVSPIIIDGGQTSLAELNWGSGLALFGGMTTTNWHSPNTEAVNLRQNMLAYANAGAGAGYTYVWNTGETTEDITITTSGIYCVTITDCNGCTASSCFNAVVSNPQVTITQSPSDPTTKPVLTANGTGSEGCGCVAFYLHSNVGNPWGVTNNQDEMNAVFGLGNWTEDFFETANAAAIFDPATCFVFLEGGDNNALAMDAFVTANITTIENWVANGGHLFMNAAPNQNVSMNWGFGGVVNNYINLQVNGVAVNPFHPIYMGPFTPTLPAYTGNWWAHSDITGGGATQLIVDGGMTSLTELNWGSGLALFGGMTTTNWHSPLAEAVNLRQNILTYASGGAGTGYTYLWNTGETTMSITPNAFGVYCVTITDCNGCTASACYQFVHAFQALVNTQPGGNSHANANEAPEYRAVASPIRLFPNPATSTTTVEFSLEMGQEVTLRVFDLGGKMVYGKTAQFEAGDNQIAIPVQGMPNGTYYVRLIQANALYTEKLTIKH